MNAFKFSIIQSTLLCLILLSAPLWAQRTLDELPEPDITKELAAFTMADGFEINLYAATPMIAKPTQINFDSEGRLWVAGSHIYPQLNVNETPSDQIVILTDTNGDGVVDKQSLFYNQLLIPGGVQPDGKGGAYIADGEALLHLHDTNGDGRGDRKDILLTGFGTEDSHHTLHRLSWGPNGKLHMLQGYYIGTHVETLYGPRRLNGGGLWSYDIDSRRLEIFSRGLVNPWGLSFDAWGQAFQTDGAGSEGVAFSFPDSIFLGSPGESYILPSLLTNRPKHCGITIISGGHFPDSWQGNVIASDFRANNIDRYAIEQDGSTYKAALLGDLLSSSHQAFRPIDTVMGPDGALYIADWYNPIIQHGEVDFRDQRRDHIHGRIWRVTAKNRPLLKKPDYKGATIEALLDLLKANENWVRLFAKQELRARNKADVAQAIEQWVARLDGSGAQFDHHRLEALFALQTIGVVNESLLKAVAGSKTANARAGAMRMLYHDHDKISDALSILKHGVNDPKPQVVREAVTALGQCGSVEAFNIAMDGHHDSMARFYEFALWRTCRKLAPYWMPLLKNGELKSNGNSQAMLFALKASGDNAAAKILIKLFKDEGKKGDGEILQAIGKSGDVEDLNFLTEIISGPNVNLYVHGAIGLNTAANERGIYPTKNIESALKQLFAIDSNHIRVLACQLAAHWGAHSFLETVQSILSDTQGQEVTRKAAAKALAGFNTVASRAFLKKATSENYGESIRVLAATALTQVDVTQGTKVIAQMLTGDYVEASVSHMMWHTLRKEGVFNALASALKGKTIPEEAATFASRIVQSSGRPGSDELLKALAKAGGLAAPLKLNVNLKIIDLLAKLPQGDVQRGAAIYKRPALACIACHKVAGSGVSTIGPDLGSIGASAPTDYIIESLLAPSKKIKEGYRSTTITASNGDVYVGSITHEDVNIIRLKTAVGTEATVKKTIVKSRETSKISMMPVGLIDSLTEIELIDLIKYLSELGKNH